MIGPNIQNLTIATIFIKKKRWFNEGDQMKIRIFEKDKNSYYYEIKCYKIKHFFPKIEIQIIKKKYLPVTG